MVYQQNSVVEMVRMASQIRCCKGSYWPAQNVTEFKSLYSNMRTVILYINGFKDHTEVQHLSCP